MKLPPESNITPDRWVVLEITSDEGVHRKILSAWLGGYADGDSWRMSSAIADETEMKHYNEYVTESGSTYRCLHAHEGLTDITRNILEQLREKHPDAQVKVLCYGDPT